MSVPSVTKYSCLVSLGTHLLIRVVLKAAKLKLRKKRREGEETEVPNP
jgi:hypothetical protein